MNLPVPDRKSQPPQFYPSNYVQSLKEAAHLGFASTRIDLGFDVTKPYVMCFHATAGASKKWDADSWIQVGKSLSEKGLQVILPWGNETEKAVSQMLAKSIPGAIVPNSFSISDAFGLIAGAQLTIGVDTGLTHLSAILNCPTIELYCDSPRWKTEGYWFSNIENLGDKGVAPAVSEVLVAMERLLVK
jgi:heptosyltransferase-1